MQTTLNLIKKTNKCYLDPKDKTLQTIELLNNCLTQNQELRFYIM